eukprot:CAMPEP_0118930520 /NCGR_PEP_ID=MMETSP1169-20130426/7177_1 /TAXON_ID=36882 /ORGANISM="Pyramimonas obovata, Strain CCMP722" /LENGTH=474 /DNA_ID=CAMNT_0006872885 /DNA_START=196 /DNA_END=1616 /DNA_ORIENTATION=-
MAASMEAIGAARMRLLRSRETDAGMPSTCKHVDLGAVATLTKTEQVVSDLKLQNTFLEDQVKRLSDQLSKFQALGFTMDNKSPGGRSGDGMSPTGFLEGMVEGAPLPPWLTDAQYLSPLLVAYDQRLLEQEKQMEEQDSQVRAMRARVEEVVYENERLAGDLSHHMMLLNNRAEANVSALPDEYQELLGRIQLLTKENDLLVMHQQAQAKDLQQMSQTLEERTASMVKMQTEASGIIHARDQALHDVKELDSVCNELQAEMQAMAEKVVDLERGSSKLQSVVKAKEDARKVLDDLNKQLQGQLEALREEHQRTCAREEQANGLNAALQRDLDTTRAAAHQAGEELAVARRDAGELREAAAALEARLAEYNRKDIEVFQRIKQAKTSAEEAVLARDQVLAREAGLDAELADLRRQLAEERTGFARQLEAEVERATASTQRANQNLREDSKRLEARVAEAEAELAALTAKLQKQER